jgi:hypothetical protein
MHLAAIIISQRAQLRDSIRRQAHNPVIFDNGFRQSLP